MSGHIKIKIFDFILKKAVLYAIIKLVVTKKETAMIKVILWDIDGTLLNFLAAEKNAIRACFEKFGLGDCTDEMIERYSSINKKYWKMLENGEIDKPAVLRGRFEEFFAAEGIDFGGIDELNAEYQQRLGDTIVYCDNSFELVTSLKGRVKQYAVTNGTFAAQSRKLRLSHFGELLDGVFISDTVGFEKPRKEFFDAVFEKIGHYSADEALIVGDSLNSDMRGGNNAGILCCWYNPLRDERPENIKIDFEITDLNQVKDII